MKTQNGPIIDISRIGVDVAHDSSFVIDRPRGSGDYVFLHFTTPIHIHVQGGRSHAKEGACILYTPGFTQWYSGITAGFTHHWFHFSGSGVEAILRMFRIPRNEIFRPLNTSYAPLLLSEIKAELSRKMSFWEKAVELLFSKLLLEIYRNLEEHSKVFATPYKAELWEKFIQVHALVEDEPHRLWTVKQLADMMHLSESRFTALFREFFGHSPMEEVIRARLRKACWLLTNTTLSVKNVAEQCGCENIYYFSRLFHRRIGCAPRDYYKKFVP